MRLKQHLTEKISQHQDVPELLKKLILSQKDKFLPPDPSTIFGYANSLVSHIHAQIAAHAYTRVLPENLEIEPIPKLIEQSKSINLAISGEQHGSMLFRSETKNLNDLMYLYDWTTEEKSKYNDKNYTEDDAIISHYYQFKEAVDLLNILEYKAKDYQKSIDKQNGFISNLHYYTKPTANAIRDKLHNLQQEMRDNLELQLRCFKTIFSLPHVIDNILRELTNPDFLDELINKLTTVAIDLKESFLMALINTELEKIKEKALAEILDGAKINFGRKAQFLLENTIITQNNYDELNSFTNQLKITLSSTCGSLQIMADWQLDPCSFQNQKESKPAISLNTPIKNNSSFFRSNPKARILYPALLAEFGIQQDKATGPRVHKVLMQIAQVHGKEIAVEVANQFCKWAKKHCKQFNLSEIRNFIVLADGQDKTTLIHK